jgi:glycosyltransferase involved in cell wall biosynthesis
MKKNKILFFVTEDWYFWSHRLPIARAARDAGAEVIVVTRVNQHGARIENEGFRLIPVQLERQGRNILRELRSLIEIARIYLRERPDLVHHVAVKPVIYGSFAAMVARVPYIVNALAGLGYIFVNKGLKASIVRRIFILIYRFAFFSKSTSAIFQNPEDQDLFVTSGIVDRKKTVLIRGSGVDISSFNITPESPGQITIMLASRMLWDKGVGELVEAAEELRIKGVDCRIVLVGKPDDENPKSIPEETLRDWHNKGSVEWWGHQENMTEVLSKAHIVVLPSYREGVPKVLIEAAACGRAIVATDVPGCREIVRHGKNGLLVPPQDVKALVESLEVLVGDSGLRNKMGKCGREIVRTEFSEEIVITETMHLYDRLIGK